MKWILYFPFIVLSIFISLIFSHRRYPKKHAYSSHPGNAYRHAIWNVVLAYLYPSRVSKKLQMAQDVTDAFEKVHQNPKADAAMDLHNNAVGRRIFEKHYKQGILALERSVFDTSQKAIYLERNYIDSLKIEELHNLFENQMICIHKKV